MQSYENIEQIAYEAAIDMNFIKDVVSLENWIIYLINYQYIV